MKKIVLLNFIFLLFTNLQAQISNNFGSPFSYIQKTENSTDQLHNNYKHQHNNNNNSNPKDNNERTDNNQSSNNKITTNNVDDYSIVYTALNIDTVADFPVDDTRSFVGKTCHIDLSPSSSGLSFEQNGLKIWRVGICSKGAASISLVLSDFNIPEDAVIYIYNPNHTHVIGGFTAENNNPKHILPIQSFKGDSLIFEYQEPLNAEFNGTLRITEAIHNYTTIRARCVATFYSGNTCSPHASLVPETIETRRSSCLLYVTGSVYSWWGSGTLINNTGGEPYILTAAHNVDETDIESKVICYFNYEVPAQDTLVKGAEDFTIAGTVLKAKAFDLDFALLSLNQMPPKDYRPYLAGWNLTNSPNWSKYYCVQHPNGDIKRVSISTDTPTPTTYPGGDLKEDPHLNCFWLVPSWSIGTTEGGSSGSALMNENGQIIGGLTGGNSYCNSPYEDYYYRIDKSWDYYPSNTEKQLKCWLDPNDAGLQAMDGTDPYELDKPCERIQHIAIGENLSKEYIGNSIQGLMAGHNGLQQIKFAEKFDNEQTSLLYGAYVMPAIGTYNEDALVYLKAYSGTDLPEEEIGSALINPQELDCTRSGVIRSDDKITLTQKENYIRFATPIEVDKTFFVGYEIQYLNVDTFAVYMVNDRNNSEENSAYYNNGAQWKPYTEHPYHPMHTALWIEPIISQQQETAITETSNNNTTIKAFPNPCNDSFEIIGLENEENCTYRIININGKVIKTGKGTQVTAPIAKGIYFLEINNIDQTETIKFIRK